MARRRPRTGVNTPGRAAGVTSPMTNGGPNVAYIRPELMKILPQYERIRDCIAGSFAVKAKREQYLPMPNGADKSDENYERYEAYLERAVFYKVVFRTVHALVGQIFLRDPQQDLPTGLQPLVEDANGEGVTLDQTAKLVSLDAISIGRAGLHVDYSNTPGGITAQAAGTGDYRPVIYAYSGPEIRNWRKAQRGSRMVYTLVVVMEAYHVADDGFEAKTRQQFKVMRLVNPDQANNDLSAAYMGNGDGLLADYGDALQEAYSNASDIYKIEVWRSDSHTDIVGTMGLAGTYAIQEVYYPKDSKGKFLNEIPFMFVGSEQNDDSIDAPPFDGMAELNIGHYHNSADYEESVFLIGQPTPYVSGVTQEWNETVLKGVIQLGSRGVIPLPAGGTAGLLQANPNTLAYEAMNQKERQMVALGAKLVEQRGVQRTATEAEMESTADTSILANIAQNVSTAMQWALRKACVFTGDDPEKVTYVLNKEFDLTKMPADARQQLLLEFEADMITFKEMRANLRRGGIATEDDETAQKEIDKQKAEKQAVLQANAANKLNLKPVDPNAAPSPPTPGSTGNTPGNTPT